MSRYCIEVVANIYIPVRAHIYSYTNDIDNLNQLQHCKLQTIYRQVEIETSVKSIALTRIIMEWYFSRIDDTP